MTPVEIFAKIVEWSTVVVATIILVSSIDDLMIDIWFWSRAAYRTLIVRPRIQPLRPEDLERRPEQMIAIAIPAWREADVIGPMIDNLVNGLRYRNYKIYLGTYPNDEETVAEVERLRRRYARLTRVELGVPGPTCKADCLNGVVREILQAEGKEGASPLAGVVLHDCEDVVHPLELKFFNYLLPRKDMVQIPVLPLERHWTNLVGNTYMDEFSEAHGKDLVVRESLTGAVPSAGVGTCFSREALKELVSVRNGEPFNTATLTEDYDIAARLQQAGMASIIARFPVDTDVRRSPWFGGEGRAVNARLPLSVREFFPDTFVQASRQRARWIIGIGLQSWKQIGWEGSFLTRYFLLRDRKGVLTSLVAALAYVLGILIGALYLAQIWELTGPLSLFASEPFMKWLFLANFVLLIVRVVQRAYFVGRYYGPAQALLSAPRLVVSNFLNFVAAVRAWSIFISHSLEGKTIGWDKTDHDFPSIERGGDRRRLGELLLAWGSVEPADLDTALEENRRTRRPLGLILVAHGWLEEDVLAEAVAYQSGLQRAEVSAETVTRNLGALPVDAFVRARALPLDRIGGARAVAVSAPLSADARRALSLAAGSDLVERIARDSEIAEGLRLLRGGAPAAYPAVPLLGDLIAERLGQSRERFEAAMSTYTLGEGRIGDFLVRRGLISSDVLQAAIAEQQRLIAAHAASAPRESR